MAWDLVGRGESVLVLPTTEAAWDRRIWYVFCGLDLLALGKWGGGLEWWTWIGSMELLAGGMELEEANKAKEEALKQQQLIARMDPSDPL